jgi:acetoin utilization deacetylase AcuC-like enzyme
MKILFSPACLEYREPGHPESPDRVGLVHDFLKYRFEFVEPEPCPESDILLAHSGELLEKVKTGSFHDPDTPNLQSIYNYALLSAGSAIKAAELALSGERSFSLMRPPGHHAGRDFLGGFCYFNNIAVAVSKNLKKVNRAVVIDFDCHHGNGSQDIFLGNEKVFYISLHQSPLYPGTGLASEKNCLNYPLPAGTGEKEYMEIFKEALSKAKKFAPGLVAVSAGFDTYRQDPLTGLELEKKSYRKIGELIAGLESPSFAVLEGGYSRDMPQCVYEFLRGYSGA